MQVLCSICALIWAPKTAQLRQSRVFLSPLLGTPENARVMQHFCPHLGPQDDNVEAANCDFVPFVSDAQECTGYLAFLPLIGAPRRQGGGSHL